MTTLRSARPDVTHDDFVHAVAEEFHHVFSKVAEETPAPDLDRGVIEQIDEEALKGDTDRSDYIEQGISELKVRIITISPERVLFAKLPGCLCRVGTGRTVQHQSFTATCT